MDFPDPNDCPYMTGKRVANHIECVFAERLVWVDCTTPFCGEPPICRFAPIDNSDEARSKRLEWLAGDDA